MSAALGRVLHRLTLSTAGNPASKLAVRAVVARPGARVVALTAYRTKSTATVTEKTTTTTTKPKAAPKKSATTTTTKKKTTTKKAATGKKAAAGSTAKKTAAKKTKKTAASKGRKTAGKKAAPKKKARTALTPEEREAKAERKKDKEMVAKRVEARATALKPPHKYNQRVNGVQVWFSEVLAGKAKSINADAWKGWKELSEAEKAKYEELAAKKKETRRAAYEAWIETHTPDEIYKANVARRWLERNNVRGDHTPLHDHRLPKGPKPSFITFYEQNKETFPGTVQEKVKAASGAWKGMSEADKKPYKDLAMADRERYTAERKSIFATA